MTRYPFLPSPYYRNLQKSILRPPLSPRDRVVVADIKMSNSISPSTLILADRRRLRCRKEGYELGEATKMRGEPVGAHRFECASSNRLKKSLRERQTNIGGYYKSRPLCDG